MSEQVVKKNAGNTMTGNRTKIRTMVQMGMLSAVAVVLMMVEFPIPFLAPPFYKFDFSEVPVLIGCFAMGPMAGVGIELIKVLLFALIRGSATAGVGEVANFLMGCAFIIPAALFYRYRKSRKFAMIGMGVGTIAITVASCFLNAFILLPAYGAAFGMTTEVIVSAGAAINSAIDNLFTFVVLVVAPFNLVKALVVSFITLLLYKRIRVLLKGE